MGPEDLESYRVPSEPRVRHDGRVVFTLTQMNFAEDRYDRNLWILDGDDCRRFTTSDSDRHPRWSPDGSTVAFLRKVDDVEQIALIPADGGEAAVITEFDLGVESFEWSPDGAALAACAVTWVDEWQDLDDDERARKPRRVGAHPYRFDSMGWTHDRRRHIWLVPTDGSDARCLTPGDRDERWPAWSPDGDRVAFLTDLGDRLGLDTGSDVAEVDVARGQVTQAIPRGSWFHASYGPGGDLHVIGDPSPDWPGVAAVWRRGADGQLVALTEHLDRSATSTAAGRPSISWAGDDLITGHEDAGSFGLVRVSPDGTVRHIVAEREVVSGWDTIDGESIVLATSHATEPGTVVRVGSDGTRTPMTDFNDDLELTPGHHFRVASGGTEIDAWVFLPETDGPVPGLVNIHGGPSSQYGFGFFDEFQVYVDAGYAVIACNPRGSSGRGRDHVTAVTGDGWGVVDREDITNVVAAALDRYPAIDRDRLGVMGGSYGGYMTAWLTANEDRWRSAVVERALLSFGSFAGTSDIGPTFPALYTGADYPGAWGTWWEKSPLSMVDRVRTPTLVLHSEADFRCPIEQAEQWFTGLLRNGVETEMVRFPGESHELSRSGSPRHRRERFDAILDWHRRHLG